jgi:hypothetical protein
MQKKTIFRFRNHLSKFMLGFQKQLMYKSSNSVLAVDGGKRIDLHPLGQLGMSNH